VSGGFLRGAGTRGQQGFTLLEVLIALVIAALALGVLFQAGIGGVRSAQIAARYDEAVSRARSHLEMMTHGGALAPGDWQGDDGGGFHWHVRVTSVAQTAIRPTAVATPGTELPAALALYAVSVRVSWSSDGTTREVRLDTQQIGAAVSSN
jgi:general secretion pathway protein I